MDFRADLIRDLGNVQVSIDDDYRAFEDDEEPGIQYTLGTNDDMSEYAAQTGDNSFTGAAYGFPNWAVTGVYRSSDLTQLADDLLTQLADLGVEVIA